MVDKEQEEEPQAVDPSERIPPPTCGSKPTRPGSSNPGDWSCREGEWVWIENIGG